MRARQSPVRRHGGDGLLGARIARGPQRQLRRRRRAGVERVLERGGRVQHALINLADHQRRAHDQLKHIVNRRSGVVQAVTAANHQAAGPCERLPRETEARPEIAQWRGVHDRGVVAVPPHTIRQSTREVSGGHETGERPAGGEIVVGDLRPEVHQISVRVGCLPEDIPTKAQVQRQA